MKHKYKKWLSLFLSLVMLLPLVNAAAFPASAAENRVKYLDQYGTERYADGVEIITDDTSDLTGSEYGTKWYATGRGVPSYEGYYKTIGQQITVDGDVSLIVRDNWHVIIQGGIYVSEGSTLRIYGQKNVSPDEINLYSTGTLSAVADNNAAGIGGKKDSVGGSVVINSGVVFAAGEDGAGIGGGYDNDSGFTSVVINGGIVKATGESGGAGIGGGEDNEHEGAFVEINGGIVTAQGGGSGGAGIGGGCCSNDWVDVTVNGGIVQATGGKYGAGIGGGEDRGNGVIRINGGTVTADGGEKGGAGIGGGKEGDQDCAIYISGGDVKTHGELAAGIGGGRAGNGGDVYISGGTVYAEAGSLADGIGAGKYESWDAEFPTDNAYSCGDTNISGGYVTAVSCPDPLDVDAGAGIGSINDTVNITGGVVVARAYKMGAGIGSGRRENKSAGTINISNACVVATSVDGAGIGNRGGEVIKDKDYGNSTVVNIDNSYVFAMSTYRGAGIGGGNDTNGCRVNITNSEVTAIGGNIDYDWLSENGVMRLGGSKINPVTKKSDFSIINMPTQIPPVSVSAAVSAVLTILNQIVYSGSYRGAGIGGGDEGKGGVVTIHNSNVLAVGGGDGANGFGRGGDTDSGNGTLTLDSTAKVLTGSDEDDLEAVGKDSRVSSAFASKCVAVTPCDHEESVYRGVPGGHAVDSCVWCGAGFDESSLAPHAFGDDKLCEVCGFEGVTVSFSSGSFEGYMAPVVIGRGASYKLPEAGPFNCGQYGYLQSGWLIDDVTYGFGETVTVDGDTTITAVYSTAHDVVIVRSDYGTVTADRGVAAAGTAVTLTATPDPGCRLTGIRVRAGGDMVYERAGDLPGGIHTFTMPDTTAAVYSTFEKKVYAVRTDAGGFYTEISVLINGGTGNAVSFGDTVTVSVPLINGIQGIVWTETDAEGGSTGERHALPLNADGSVSFPFTAQSDILITPNGLHEHDGVTFAPWGVSDFERSSLPVTGNFYLVSDVLLGSAWHPSGDVRLCLNGHTVAAAPDFTGESLFDIRWRELSVHDHEDAGRIDGQGKCGLVYLTNSRFALWGGTLTGGSAAGGSAVAVNPTNGYENFCSFTMHGGVITGNTGTSQGVVLPLGAPFTMDGGSIIGNSAPAAVDIPAGAAFSVSGSPVIRDNIPEGRSYQANVLLRKSVINVIGPLSGNAVIGVTVSRESGFSSAIPVTQGLPGNGSLADFFSDDDLLAAGLRDGEVVMNRPATVSFDPNGAGGIAMDPVTVAVGCDFTLPWHTYNAPSGKAFGGWKTGDSDNVLPEGSVITVDGDLTLRAVWLEGSGDTAEIEWHTHRWEIRADENDPSKATVRCVNTMQGGGALCNETDARTVQIRFGAAPGAYTKVWDGQPVAAQIVKQRQSQFSSAFFDDSLITIGEIGYYDENGVKTSSAPVNAGTYVAMATVSPVNGIGQPAVIRQTVTVTKAAAPDITVSGRDLTYQSSRQELVEATDVSAFGTVYFRINGGNWRVGVPQAQEPGEYTVEWFFEGFNHQNLHSQDAPGAVQSSISELHNHEGVDFIRWADTGSLPTEPGSYFLTGDVSLADDWTVNGDINLCLFGKKIDLNGHDIFLRGGGITLYADGAGTVTGTGGVHVGRNAVLNSRGVIFGGIVNNNAYTAYGYHSGAITLLGEFHMDGGRITDSHGQYGGVDVAPGAYFGVAGNPVIKNNTGNGDTESNVYLSDDSCLVHIEDSLKATASIGVSAVSGSVFTSGFASVCPDLAPEQIFSVDSPSTDTLYIALNGEGEAAVFEHTHGFEIRFADGREDKAVFLCADEENCPLAGTVYTVELYGNTVVYDGEEHEASCRAWKNGEEIDLVDNAVWADGATIALTYIYYLDYRGVTVSRYDPDLKKLVDCAPYNVGEYTACIDFMWELDGDQTRITLTAPLTVHEHSAGENVRENETAATCTRGGSYEDVTYCTVCGAEMSRVTGTSEPLPHSEEVIPAVPSSCERAGLTEGIKCSVCGKVLLPQQTDEKKEHVPAEAVVENEVAAACDSEGGYETVVYCSVCGEELDRIRHEIPAKGHDFGEWTLVKEPTCTEDGEEQRVCGNDPDHTEKRPVAKTGHTDSDNDGICDVCRAQTGGEISPDPGTCKWCGRTHSGFFGTVTAFFHRIFFFFSHLFGKR